MSAAFHWIRIQTFCYPTEDKELLRTATEEIAGTPEITEEPCEGEHGEIMIILEARLSKQKEFAALFRRLGEPVCRWIMEDADNRTDEDCMFYLRLDKQKAVSSVKEVAHHGDVIAITGKIQSHPARKDVAVSNLREFLEKVLSLPEETPPS